LPHDAIILDAGAYNGNDSIDFAMKMPTSSIYAIEPVTQIYKELTDNTKNYNNIKCFNLALDDKVGEKEIYISSGYSVQSSSLLKPKEHLIKFPDCKFESSEIVKTTTINQFVKDQNIDKIDCMWLDLQGNEHKVLSQASDIIWTTKVIFAEYSLVEYYEGLMLYDEFKLYMSSLGFKEVINENIYNYLGCGNSLFIRNI
jgi:FkbM family methyltransferase